MVKGRPALISVVLRKGESQQSILKRFLKKCKKENRPALITYTVAGDPNKKKSFEILKAISLNADICEIGVGHNCNTGDGKQIQDSTYRAIKMG